MVVGGSVVVKLVKVTLAIKVSVTVAVSNDGIVTTSVVSAVNVSYITAQTLAIDLRVH